jgi:hypothetical protein
MLISITELPTKPRPFIPSWSYDNPITVHGLPINILFRIYKTYLILAEAA